MRRATHTVAAAAPPARACLLFGTRVSYGEAQDTYHCSTSSNGTLPPNTPSWPKIIAAQAITRAEDKQSLLWSFQPLHCATMGRPG